MIPLTAVEEFALPVDEEPTERDQPVVLVPITFLPSLVSNVSKPPFKTKDSSFSVLVDEEEEDEEDDEDVESLQAASAVNEDNIIIDKQRARSCFLRFLILVFI
jgi:hypothetical protein